MGVIRYMNILLVSNMYPSENDPSFGTFVQSFHQQMESEGLNCQLAVIKGREHGKLQKLKKYFRFFRDVTSQVKSCRHDLVYVHFASHSLLPLLLVKKYLTKPLIINMHGGDVFTKSKFAAVIQKRVTPLIKRADLIVVPSSYFKDVVIEKFGLADEKVFVSPSGGVDTARFKPMGDVVGETVTFGYLSRIDEGKGWEVFLNALALLKARELTFNAMVVGGGQQQNLLIEKVATLDLQDIVDVKGPQPHLELPKYFNQMDVFVFPTQLLESLGLVGLEAMACGLPVVGSNIGGLKGYIKPGVNGELFSPGDSHALADKLESFIVMAAAAREQYKINALTTAASFSDQLIKKELANIIKEVVINHHDTSR